MKITTATAHSSSLVGLEAHPVQVKASISRGIPALDLVGLPETSVVETRVRVRSALDQIWYQISGRVLVEITPVDLRKYGAGFDLAIALAILAASSRLPAEKLEHWMIVGELSLTGAVRPVRGVLPHVLCAARRSFPGAIVPAANGAEAAIVEGINVRLAGTLKEVLGSLSGGHRLDVARIFFRVPSDAPHDLSEVRGPAPAKRALEIAAAGGHNMLFVGPPGGGKTMLARTMPGLLPPMSFQEAIEATSVHSVAGLLQPGVSLLPERPIRAPHHTASTVGLVGGGDPPRPGEMALAHNGVLFLDELPEFTRDTLEGLREPLEEGSITIVRARSRIKFPAHFMLMAAMNPCPCGYHGDPSDRCSCSDDRVNRYRARVPGELLDRIDLHVSLPPVKISQLGDPADGPTNAEVRSRVVASRQVQMLRNPGVCNGRLTPKALREVVDLSPDTRSFFSTAADRLGLSSRMANKVLRVARTIADLASEKRVEVPHISEAIGLVR